MWPDDPPRDPKGWLVTVAWRKFLDAARAETSRRQREERVEVEPSPDLGEDVDDTLQLYFLCAHPSLTPASAVALTLRAVGGLTTRQIATGIPRAGGDHGPADQPGQADRLGVRFNQPGDVATVLRVLYLVFNEGYSGNVDLAAEAIRLTRQLVALTDEPEVAGLLALMLLHHARRASRTGPGGRLVPLGEQDRSRWDTGLIAEGVTILQAALARDRLGEYQAQAAIAALHADARSTSETDWGQIVEWYDELLLLTGSPVVRLNRAVAVGEAEGPQAGLAALADVNPDLPRYAAVTAYLHERAGDLEHAAELYAEAARAATSVPERDHLTRAGRTGAATAASVSAASHLVVKWVTPGRTMGGRTRSPDPWGRAGELREREALCSLGVPMPASPALGVQQVGEQVRGDHHGVVPGRNLDHSPAGRPDPGTTRLGRPVERVGADDVGRRQAVADRVAERVRRRVGSEGMGCHARLHPAACAGSLIPNALAGGTGMLRPPLESCAALVRAATTSGGRTSKGRWPCSSIIASR